MKIPNKITIEINTMVLKFKVNTKPPVFILPNISVSKRVRSDSCKRAIIVIESFLTFTPIIKNTIHSPRFMSLITHSAAMDMCSPYMFISPHKIVNRPRRKTIANIEILKRVVVRILGNLPDNMNVRNAETTGIKISKYINKNSILSPSFIHKVFSNVLTILSQFSNLFNIRNISESGDGVHPNLLGFYLIFKIFLRLDKQQSDITKIVRYVAIKEVKVPKEDQLDKM